MEANRGTLRRRSSIRFAAAMACGIVLVLVAAEGPAASAATCDPPGPPPRAGCVWSVDICDWVCAVCDPPGPPPRFGCSWSLDTCEWVCAVCDPFGAPPRSSCSWDGYLCDWVCPGYTGTAVTVETQHGPTRDDVVYVKLSSVCTATGSSAFCSGSFAVQHGISRSVKCQAIADAIASSCGAAGYAVSTDDCPSTASFTATNPGCPGTQFALGISNDPAVFDQSQQTLPDGESESTTGICAPIAGPVGNLRVDKFPGGTALSLTWDPAANAQSYVTFTDGSANGSFGDIAGSTTYGATEQTIPMPAGTQFYLLAARNESCGVGAKH